MSRLRSTTLQIGDLAPAFALFALNEQFVHLADVLDEVPLLLVFAPGAWSPNSRRQLEELSACYERLHAAGVGVLAIVTQDARSLRRRLATQMPPFPILADENREAARSFGVFRALSWDGIGVTRPATFLIDRAGAVRFIYVGERDPDLPETDALIRLVADVFQVEVPASVAEALEEVVEVVESPAEGEEVLVDAASEEAMRLVAVVDDFAVAAELAPEESSTTTIPDSAEAGRPLELASAPVLGVDHGGPAPEASSGTSVISGTSLESEDGAPGGGPEESATAPTPIDSDQESTAGAVRGNRSSRRGPG